VVTTTTWKSNLTVAYLTELSGEKKRAAREKMEQEIHESLQQFTDYVDKETRFKELMDEWERAYDNRKFADYVDKENVGRIYTGGFFNDLVSENPDGTHTAAANLSKEESEQRLHDVWAKHLAVKGPPRGIKQHRFVMSMSAEQHDLLVAHGINPEAILHERVRLAMKEFREKYHQGDSVGYSYGFHHDTDNLHVHIAIYPRSKHHKYVGLSDQLHKKIVDNGQENQLEFLKDVCVRENERMTRAFSNQQEKQKYIQRLQRKKNAAEFFFVKDTPPPLLPNSPEHEEYLRLRREHQRVKQLRQQVREGRQNMRKFSSVASRLSLLAKPFLLPNEVRQIQQIGGAIASLIAMSRGLRATTRRFFGARNHYLQLHQQYYNPLKSYGISTRNRIRFGYQAASQAQGYAF
jgi:hypothetical protein